MTTLALTHRTIIGSNPFEKDAKGIGENSKIYSPIQLERSSLNVIQVHEKLDDLSEEILETLDLENVIDMAAGSGTGFNCYRPKSDEKLAEEAKLKEKELKEKEEKEAQDSEEKENEDNLLSIEEKKQKELDREAKEMERALLRFKGSCFVKRMGYWSFKVCPFDRIEQIHYEGSSTKIQFDLGKYVSMRKYVNPEGVTYWIQSFLDGTNGRKSELHFQCRPSIDASTPVITNVQEPALHEYEIKIVTSVVCKTSVEMEIRSILNKMMGQCFSKTEGWWTYEICPFKYVRQYHKYKDGREDVYILGEYDNQANLEMEMNKKVLKMDKNTHRQQYEQVYTSGTKCEVEQEHVERNTVIQYVCNRNGVGTTDNSATTSTGSSLESGISSNISPTRIISITESPSCHYNVVIHINQLCQHPLFKETTEAVKTNRVTNIHCVLQ